MLVAKYDLGKDKLIVLKKGLGKKRWLIVFKIYAIDSEGEEVLEETEIRTGLCNIKDVIGISIVEMGNLFPEEVFGKVTISKGSFQIHTI